MRVGDTHEYATWDAAYVLGSLSSADRREYEAHLSQCVPCRLAVNELCGLVAMLRWLSRDDLAAIDKAVARGSDNTVPQLPKELLAEVSWRRRPARMLTWAMVAAVVVVVVVGVVLTCQAKLAQSPARQAEGTVLTTATPASTDVYSATMMISGRSGVPSSTPMDHIAEPRTSTNRR